MGTIQQQQLPQEEVISASDDDASIRSATIRPRHYSHYSAPRQRQLCQCPITVKEHESQQDETPSEIFSVFSIKRIPETEERTMQRPRRRIRSPPCSGQMPHSCRRRWQPSLLCLTCYALIVLGLLGTISEARSVSNGKQEDSATTSTATPLDKNKRKPKPTLNNTDKASPSMTNNNNSPPSSTPASSNPAANTLRPKSQQRRTQNTGNDNNRNNNNPKSDSSNGSKEPSLAPTQRSMRAPIQENAKTTTTNIPTQQDASKNNKPITPTEDGTSYYNRNAPSKPSADEKPTSKLDSTKPTAAINKMPNDRHNKDFLNWCRQVLGIQTSLEIATFEYYDYMKAMPDEDWQDNLDGGVQNVENFDKIAVRGLAASRDIAQGEVVIRIPLQALVSVTTTIDQDPVLSQVMGPEARQKHGWDYHHNNQNNDDSRNEHDAASLFMVELPLLAMALLHHKRLGGASPLYHYMQILQQEDTTRLPFLWSSQELRQSVSEGIRTVARGVQHEMQEMYNTIVVPLVAEHPDLFGKPPGGGEEEWMFSYQQFQWAFAMVNTRHWQLPIQDLEHQHNNNDMNVGVFVEDNAQPPATTPTDEWALQRQAASQEDGEGDNKDDNESTRAGRTGGGSSETEKSPNNNNKSVDDSKASSLVTQRHSFLAPVADLLNFGPPCTRGHYNAQLHSFEIIASCDLEKGQEVTFWYTSECDHVVVGVYGFMSPLVKPCPSAEEYRQSAEEWQARAARLQSRLDTAAQQLQILEESVEYYRDVLLDCDCCDYDDEFLPDLFDDDQEYEDDGEEEHGHNVRGAAKQNGHHSSSPEQHQHRRHARDEDYPDGHHRHVAAEHGNTQRHRRWKWGRMTKEQDL